MIRTAADVTAADVTAIFYLFNHSIPDLRQERTYTASAAVTCCDLGLEETMALVSGERAPAFTAQELEKLVDGVRAHQKKDICHRQGRPDPGGPPETEHPLPEEMGGHSPLEQEDGGGSTGDGLPMWEGCPSNHDPPDVPDPGGGLPGVGWALEGITADTRG
ncbi:hypothetical protein NDU88_008849 [Pleurodeles waltl]|uniref:Uncharacterized protein n=1 Tax=Pleurodeles waltl TaxID=8319 RepID=A0AAV7NXG6_PLEWA|nr:hypothetical protein NDU88_008849 [Pleurodeles waltl]